MEQDKYITRKNITEEIIGLCNRQLGHGKAEGVYYGTDYFYDTYARTLEEKMAWTTLLEIRDKLAGKERSPEAVEGILKNAVEKECGRKAVDYLGMSAIEEDAFRWYRESGFSKKKSKEYLRKGYIGARAATNQRAVDLVMEAAEYEKAAGARPEIPSYHPDKLKNLFRKKKKESPFPYPYITQNDIAEMKDHLDTMLKTGGTAKLTKKLDDMMVERSEIRSHLSFYVISAEKLGYEDPMETVRAQFGNHLSSDTLLRGLVLAEKSGAEAYMNVHAMIFHIMQAVDENENMHAIDSVLSNRQMTPNETEKYADKLDMLNSRHFEAVFRMTAGQPRKQVLEALKARNELLRMCRNIDTANISDVALGEGFPKVPRTEEALFTPSGNIKDKFGPVTDSMMMEVIKEVSGHVNLGALARETLQYGDNGNDSFAAALKKTLTRHFVSGWDSLTENGRQQLLQAADSRSETDPYLRDIASSLRSLVSLVKEQEKEPERPAMGKISYGSIDRAFERALNTPSRHL